MSTPVLGADARIDEADRILRENPPDSWPHGREAESTIRWAYDSLLEALDTHARLLNGSLDWETLYDPDNGWWEASEDATIDHAACVALDCAKALEKRIAEYKRREDAEVLIAAGRITQIATGGLGI